MSTWINWAALGKILGVGLLAGAGLPALFAVGLKVISPHGENEIALSGAGAGSAAAVKASPVRLAAGIVCFAVVLAAIGYGVYIIVKG